MKHLSLLVVAILVGISTMAQTPSKFNYQAVARDASGALVSDGTVGVKVSILSGSASGTEVYSETHSPSTNAFGLLNFQIGSGSAATGDLSTIDWGSDAHFIKVEMDPAGGSSYTVSNTSELLSVPYAEYANSALNVDDADADPENEVQMLTMNGDTLMLSLNGGSVDMSGYDQSAGVSANDSAIAANAADIATNATNLAAHITADADVDSTNELITNMMLDGDTMLQVIEDGDTHEVDLNVLVDDGDWVRDGDTLYNTADSLIGIGTNVPVSTYKLTLNPGKNLGGLYIDRDTSSANAYGIYNYDFLGSGFRYGMYNYLYDGNSGAYGLYNNIQYMNSTEYGVYNYMYYGTGTGYGTYNRLYRTSGLGQTYGTYNYARGLGSSSYGAYNQAYNYRTSTYGNAYGAYNRGSRYGSSYGRSYGAYNYGYNTSTYGYTYGAYNYAFAGGSLDYSYGSYNYAGGGTYANYASYSSGSTYSTSGYLSSDRKLKKNIRDYQGAISDIMELQPRVYDFDTDKYPTMGLPEQEQLGLVAQELEEVFPNLVQAAHNPTLTMTEADAKEQGFEYKVVSEAQFDEEGNEAAPAMVEAGEAVDFKAVNYNGLIPVLIKGIQEQQEIIEALEARIEVLENN